MEELNEVIQTGLITREQYSTRLSQIITAIIQLQGEVRSDKNLVNSEQEETQNMLPTTENLYQAFEFIITLKSEIERLHKQLKELKKMKSQN